MYHVLLVFQCIYGCSDEGGEDEDAEKRREWRLPDLLYADDLVFCGESEEDLMSMVERFIEECRRRGLKFNAGKRKVKVLGREEGLERETEGTSVQRRIC